MKYFTAQINGQERMIGRASEAKRFLKAHPEITTIVRYWWSGDDLVECLEFNRCQIVGSTARKLEQGQTAQWAAYHKQP